MNAEIITIGDEILLGQIVDTNSAWIGQQFDLLHIKVNQITSITDESYAITKALDLAADRSDLVIVTGGLGPTKDDVTKVTISKYFSQPLVRDAGVLQHVKSLFAKYSNVPMPIINEQQADVLANSEVLFNDVGTAPGMWIESNNKIFVFLPGVPFEMKYLISNRVLPKLKQIDTNAIVNHRHIITIGLGESFLADKIKDIEGQFPPNIKLAYLPKVGLVRLRLTQVGNASISIDDLHQKLIDRLGKHVVSTKDISIEEAIVESFTADHIKLSVAESCTGGRIAANITAISGASAIFDCGIVAYHNTIKEEILSVKSSTLEDFGAVSRETVLEMVQGVKKLANADYAIATSGIAGPTGGTPDKPVGTVWVAVSGIYKTETKLFQFHNDREINIERTVANAFAMLWNMYIADKSN